ATQNAFVEAYCKLSQLRSPSQFGVWLMRIAHREATRVARRPGRERSLSDAAHVLTQMPPEPSLDDDLLLTAVGSLPEHERLVVGMRYFNGHTVDEVAQLTG